MKRLLVLAMAALGGAAWAADYTVLPLPETGTARVTISVSGKPSEFRMPGWAPGDYEMFNYGKLISGVKFYRGGSEVAGQATSDPNLWTVEGGADKVEYEVKPSKGNFSVNLRVTPQEMFISGPGVLGYFPGHTKESQTIRLNLLTPQDKAICALPQKVTTDGTAVFTAPNYDDLIDSPMVIGANVKTISFQVSGKTHMAAFYNRDSNPNAAEWQAMWEPLVRECEKLFGELPYDKYIFFCDVGGGGSFGGLEHKNGARLGIGTVNASANAGLAAHEYFHLYNVKRIRSLPLGPFDYSKPAMTSTLWWLEGVTDYYADVIRVRAGQVSQAAFMADMLRTHQSLERNPASRRTTADQASLNVWQTRGSQGFDGLSYYQKGKGVGLCLDLAIRAETNGKKSLDDVIRKLYEECKGEKGYADTRIRELCVEVGGNALGKIYDTCAASTEPMPTAELMQRCGLTWEANTPRFEKGSVAANWPMATSR